MISNEKTYLFLLAFMIFSSASLCKYSAYIFFKLHSFFPVSYLICRFFSFCVYVFFSSLLFAFCISKYIHAHCTSDMDAFSVCHYFICVYIFIFPSICILHIVLTLYIRKKERLMLIGMKCSFYAFQFNFVSLSVLHS